MLKEEPIQLKMKRIECNVHGNNIKYKCEFAGCRNPYLCWESECLEQHFHENDKLIVVKFNTTLWQSKFQEAENAINNNILKVKEEHLQKIIQYFNDSLKKIQHKMILFQEIKVKISESDGDTYNQDNLEDVNNFLSLGNKLQRKIDKLRSKIVQDQICSSSQSEYNEEVLVEECFENHQVEIQQQQDQSISQQRENIQNDQSKKIEINVQKASLNSIFQSNINHNTQNSHEEPSSQKDNNVKVTDFRQNIALESLLLSQITNFSWSQTKTVYSLQEPTISCQKFHQKLKDKTDLIFLFIGNNFIIGSYYHEPYPSIAERLRKDSHSFIFIQDEELQQKFAIFKAVPQADSHISVSEKLLICHGNTPNNGDGLRTFQRTFDSLAYFLPSRSFKDLIENREVNYNGVLKIKQFYVLQMQRE